MAHISLLDGARIQPAIEGRRTLYPLPFSEYGGQVGVCVRGIRINREGEEASANPPRHPAGATVGISAWYGSPIWGNRLRCVHGDGEGDTPGRG